MRNRYEKHIQETETDGQIDGPRKQDKQEDKASDSHLQMVEHAPASSNSEFK